jgi:glycosyltransferase involved in cell wall biosynthesis
VSGVFLAGWHAHEDLPDFFSAADAVVSASEREQFGQVLVEGMACGLPALAPRSLGPAGIIDDGRTGWLVNPDDEAALAAALSEAVEDQHERIERGRAARLAVCERFTWSGISAKLFAVLAEVVDDARPASAIEA